jgi:hypothetical protein
MFRIYSLGKLHFFNAPSLATLHLSLLLILVTFEINFDYIWSFKICQKLNVNQLALILIELEQKYQLITITSFGN